MWAPPGQCWSLCETPQPCSYPAHVPGSASLLASWETLSQLLVCGIFVCVLFFWKCASWFLSSIFLLYLKNQGRLEGKEFSSLILFISSCINYVLFFCLAYLLCEFGRVCCIISGEAPVQGAGWSLPKHIWILLLSWGQQESRDGVNLAERGNCIPLYFFGINWENCCFKYCFSNAAKFWQALFPACSRRNQEMAFVSQLWKACH